MGGRQENGGHVAFGNPVSRFVYALCTEQRMLPGSDAFVCGRSRIRTLSSLHQGDAIADAQQFRCYIYNINVLQA